MTVVRVLPRHEGDQFNGQQDFNTVTRQYEVETDGTIEDYEIVPIAINMGLLPDVGALLDANFGYRARTLNLEFMGDQDRKHWMCNVVYDNRPTDNVSPELEFPVEEYNPEQPELDPLIFTLSGREVRVPQLYDNIGRPVINSVGDQLDPGLESVYSNKVIRVEGNTLLPNDWASLINTTNDIECYVGGEYLAKNQGLITQFETNGPNYRYKELPVVGGSGGVRRPIEYWKNSMTIELSRRPVPDKGVQFIEQYWNTNKWSWRDVDISATYGEFMPWKEFASNTGTRQLIPKDDPGIYAHTIEDYDIGDRVYHTVDPFGGANNWRYWCVQANGPNVKDSDGNAIEKAPGNNENLGFWRPYASGSSGPVRIQILNGDLDPFGPEDVRFSPIDTPVWLYAGSIGEGVRAKSDADPYQFIIYDMYVSSDWRAFPFAEPA